MEKFFNKILTLSIFLFTVQTALAQLAPLGAQYYANEYMSNPAMAGINDGLRINVGHLTAWNSIPGSPKYYSLTADLGTGGKTGWGVNVYQDKAGLLNRSKVVGSYAYHLPISEGSKLNFGLSFGMLRTRLNTQEIVGSTNDTYANQFNMREENLLDGDFGLAYTSGKLTVQAAAYNLKTNFRSEQSTMADYGIYYAAASYKIINPRYSVEPKIAYRAIKNFDSMWDAGAELNMLQNQIKMLGMYHSNGSTSAGIAYQFQSKYQILGMYNTPSRGLNNYTAGTFELGLQLKVDKKK